RISEPLKVEDGLQGRPRKASGTCLTMKKSDNTSDDPDPRKQALDGVLHHIERLYGRGSILKMGDTSAMNIETTSTGSMTLDIALGGGYPRGRVVEIYGPESSGKTTLALHALAEVQKTGGVAAFIDAEHALDPAYAGHLGVDVGEMLVSQPDSGEMALDVVDQLVRSNAVDMVVVDSVAALVPRAELEGEMADMQMGLQARLMSKAMRKVTGSLSKSQCTVIFLNQLRSKIGVIYGSPEVTSGEPLWLQGPEERLEVRMKKLLLSNLLYVSKDFIFNALSGGGGGEEEEEDLPCLLLSPSAFVLRRYWGRWGHDSIRIPFSCDCGANKKLAHNS
ncbi:unnamed protein product, partial [Discosporangium mesarthrocarpum]